MRTGGGRHASQSSVGLWLGSDETRAALARRGALGRAHRVGEVLDEPRELRARALALLRLLLLQQPHHRAHAARAPHRAVLALLHHHRAELTPHGRARGAWPGALALARAAAERGDAALVAREQPLEQQPPRRRHRATPARRARAPRHQARVLRRRRRLRQLVRRPGGRLLLGDALLLAVRPAHAHHRLARLDGRRLGHDHPLLVAQCDGRAAAPALRLRLLLEHGGVRPRRRLELRGALLRRAHLQGRHASWHAPAMPHTRCGAPGPRRYGATARTRSDCASR